MKFSTIFASALAVISPLASLAAPTTSSSSTSDPLVARGEIYKRACPSPDRVADWLASVGKGGDNTIFYTGGVESAKARFFYNDHTDGTGETGTYWQDAFPASQYNYWMENECDAGQDIDNLVPNMGQGLARAATGNVYLLMRKGQREGNFWLTYEYPNLRAGVNIIAVNAEDFSDRKDYEHGEPF